MQKISDENVSLGTVKSGSTVFRFSRGMDSYSIIVEPGPPPKYRYIDFSSMSILDVPDELLVDVLKFEATMNQDQRTYRAADFRLPRKVRSQEVRATPPPTQRCTRAAELRASGLTYKKVGEMLGVSAERIRQMCAKHARYIKTQAR